MSSNSSLVSYTLQVILPGHRRIYLSKAGTVTETSISSPSLPLLHPWVVILATASFPSPLLAMIWKHTQEATEHSKLKDFEV